jgi:hypothetical protein
MFGKIQFSSVSALILMHCLFSQAFGFVIFRDLPNSLWASKNRFRDGFLCSGSHIGIAPNSGSIALSMPSHWDLLSTERSMRH